MSQKEKNPTDLLERYEVEKRELQKEILTAEEYEKKLREIAERLGV